MKRVIVFIFILLNVYGFAQTNQELFSNANKFYELGEFNEAISLYKKIEKSGEISADLYYNLGNSYYKLNEVAPSIYYFEKALKVNPSHEDAANNLRFANRMTIDEIESLPKTFLQKIGANVIHQFSFETWAAVAVIASFLAAILFLFYYFSKTTKQKLLFFNLSLIVSVLFAITIFFAFSAYNFYKKNRAAIIFDAKVEINNAPSGRSEVIFELHEGTKVLILDDLDNWKKIKLADGKIGWINSNSLKEI